MCKGCKGFYFIIIFIAARAAKERSATHQLSKGMNLSHFCTLTCSCVCGAFLPTVRFVCFSMQLTRKQRLLVNERDFPGKVRPKTSCLQPNLITKQSRVPVMQAADVDHPLKRCRQIIYRRCGLLPWSLQSACPFS